MPLHAAFLVVLAIFLVSAAGYGRTFIRIFDDGRSLGIGYDAALGILAMGLLGGVANDCSLAYRGTLDAVLVLGVLLALIETRRRLRSPAERRVTWSAALRYGGDPTVWLAAALLSLSALRLVPTTVLNPHDDLTQYLLRSTMMLQTGTLGGNWFDNVGIDGLGTQSWMQAFFLDHLPLSYADAFDDVVCLPLCCLLLNDIGRAAGAGGLRRFAAALALVAINPVQVNVSAKYSLVLMLLASVAALLVFARRVRKMEAQPASWWFPLCVTAASAATAVALKSSAAAAVVLAMVLLTMGTVGLMRDRRGRILAPVLVAVTSIVAAVIFCLPFLGQYAATTFAPHLGEGPSVDLARYTAEKIAGLLAWSGGQFGQRPVNTTIGFAIILVLAVGATRNLLRDGRAWAARPEDYVVAVFGCAAVLSFLAAFVTTPWSIARYATPVLTAVLPAAILIGWPQPTIASRPSRWGGRLHAAVASAICGAIVLLNLSSIGERLGLAWNLHTASILAANPGLPDYVARALGEERRREIAEIQAKIPAGDKMLAAILDPTDLDFVRNPGFDVFVSGMGNPWIGDFSGLSAHDISRRLAAFGIRHLLWQRSGDYLPSRSQLVTAGDTPVGFNAKSVRSFVALSDAATAGTLGPVVYAKGHYVLFTLDPDFTPIAGPPAYPLGETVDFTAENANPYLVSGWSTPEGPGTWTDGNEAKLAMRPTPSPREDLVVRATYTPLVAAGQASPVVTVAVAGTDVARWTAASVATRCARVPAHLVQDGALDLTLKIENVASPADLHISGDTRRLGILMRSLSVGPASKAGQGGGVAGQNPEASPGCEGLGAE